MEVLTTQPGAQLYTANALRPLTGKGGSQYTAHGAFCFETSIIRTRRTTRTSPRRS
jgi:galactose mutarotase-like enzyme